MQISSTPRAPKLATRNSQLATIFLTLFILFTPSHAFSQTTAPSDLLAPAYRNRDHSIQFRPPAGSVKVINSAPDSIVEFDRDDYNWQLKCWSVDLQQSLPLTIHKDQFGDDQDGVMEITIANIKRQSPDAQVLRNEVINVGPVRVGLIAVRYVAATHDRRYTQQAIFEAPNANHQLYYFFDLTGPGKPQYESDDVVNPAEKLAFDTFGQLVDSVVLLDRTEIVDFERQALWATRALFALWGGDDYGPIRVALVPDQYLRIIKDGQDIGYQHVVEQYQPDSRSPEGSILKIGVRSHMAASPVLQWDTETWMFSTADRKHEHWKTAATCTDNHGQIVDSFSQVGVSDEATKAFALHPVQNPDGAILPNQPENLNYGGPLGQGNVDVETSRTLEVNSTHRNTQLSPLHEETPVFYIPQAFNFILPEILPSKPKSYMVATFVPTPPEATSTAGVGNIMPRYLQVLPVQHVTFRGQDFDAVPISDRITLDGTLTTWYVTIDGKFLGSTSTFPTGNNGQTSTIEVVPTDNETLNHLWTRPDLSAPSQPANSDTDEVLPHSP
jgi:hypothetical protein